MEEVHKWEVALCFFRWSKCARDLSVADDSDQCVLCFFTKQGAILQTPQKGNPRKRVDLFFCIFTFFCHLPFGFPSLTQQQGRKKLTLPQFSFLLTISTQSSQRTAHTSQQSSTHSPTNKTHASWKSHHKKVHVQHARSPKKGDGR